VPSQTLIVAKEGTEPPFFVAARVAARVAAPPVADGATLSLLPRSRRR